MRRLLLRELLRRLLLRRLLLRRLLSSDRWRRLLLGGFLWKRGLLDGLLCRRLLGRRARLRPHLWSLLKLPHLGALVSRLRALVWLAQLLLVARRARLRPPVTEIRRGRETDRSEGHVLVVGLLHLFRMLLGELRDVRSFVGREKSPRVRVAVVQTGLLDRRLLAELLGRSMLS